MRVWDHTQRNAYKVDKHISDEYNVSIKPPKKQNVKIKIKAEVLKRNIKKTKKEEH